jgi:hypothetical protein
VFGYGKLDRTCGYHNGDRKAMKNSKAEHLFVAEFVVGMRRSREEMAAFYRHFEVIYPTNQAQSRSGALYSVEDVVHRDGDVAIRSGQPVATPREPTNGAPPILPGPRPVSDRLWRRGR